MLRQLTHILIITSLLFVSIQIQGAKNSMNRCSDPEKTAMELFSEGNFQQALPLFQEQLKLFPEDKMLNYYLGACMIECGMPDSTARQALVLAIEDNSPEKINYYLGIAFHAENEFTKAVEYYRQFESKAKSKTLKSTNYQQLIGLAEQGKNPFRKEEKSIVQQEKTETIANAEPETSSISKSVTRPELTIQIPPALSDSLISFQATPEIRYMKIQQFRSNEARLNFIKGWQAKQSIDSLVQSTELLRSQYSNSEAEQKEAIARQILSNEQRVIALNREMPQFDLLAHQQEEAYWEKAFPSEKDQIIKENDAIITSIEQAQKQKIQDITQRPPEVVMLPSSQKTPAPETEPVETGIVYKIQIGAFSKELPEYINRTFKKLALIRKIDTYKDEKGVNVYTVGSMKTYADALQTQKQVKLEGIKNPIIAAYRNGKRITVNEAKKLNKE